MANNNTDYKFRSLDRKKLRGIKEIVKVNDSPFNAFSVVTGHMIYLSNKGELDKQEISLSQLFKYCSDKISRLYSLEDESLLLPHDFYTLSGENIETELIGFSVFPGKGYTPVREIMRVKDLTIEAISKPVLAASRSVKESSKKGIHHPYLFTEDNMYYSGEEDRVKYDDFANVQIEGLEVNCSGAFRLTNTAFAFSGLFNPETKRVGDNFDKVALHLLFLRLATGKFPPVFEKPDLFNKRNAKFLCSEVGLDDTQFEDNLLRISDGRKLVYPDDAIKELNLTHKLVPSENSYTFMRR